VGVAAIWLILHKDRPKRPLRLARYPYQAEFTESIFNEIARRHKIPIEWVKTDLDIGDALRKGVVDIWAAGVGTPGRQREFHVTDMWTHVEFSLLALEEDHGALRPIETKGRTVGFNQRNMQAQALVRAIPGAIPTPYDSVQSMMQAICSGEVHAGMMARAATLESVLKRPSGCEKAAFRYEILPNAFLPIVILARKDMAREAEEFRSGMGEL